MAGLNGGFAREAHSGNFAAVNYIDPNMAYKAALQSGDQQRKQREAEDLNRQRQATQDESARYSLMAQKSAYNQSQALQTDSRNPRTTNGEVMNISDGSGEGSASGSARRLPTGGFGSANPQIDGRYMSMVEFKPPTLNSSPTPPREVMPEGDFTPPDAKAFQDAAFARLKDKSGALGQSAISSLASQLAGRGISGSSGTFARGTAQQIVNATQPLADLNVAHLGDEYQAAQHAQDLSANRANTIYQGGIAQRGQDLSNQNALNNLMAQLSMTEYQGKIGQRGQDLEALYRML